MRKLSKKIISSAMAFGFAIMPLQSPVMVLAQEDTHYFDSEMDVEFITVENDEELKYLLESLDIRDLPTMDAQFLPAPRNIVNAGPIHPTGIPDINLTPEQIQMAIDMGIWSPEQDAENRINSRFAPVVSSYEVRRGTIPTPGFEWGVPIEIPGPGFTFIVPDAASTVNVNGGMSAHLQLDLPRNSNLDYNLYIYEIHGPFGSNTFELVAFSENETFINGLNGTLPELIEIQNNTTSTRSFAAVVRSANGYSATEEFVLHIGFNHINNSIIDQHPNQARTLDLSFMSNFVIRSALQSTVDNDWYRFTTPSGLHYTGLRLALDQHSLNSGYAFEVYTREGSQYRRSNNMFNGRLSVLPNTTYYIRVHSTRLGNVPLSGQNYELTIEKDLIMNYFMVITTPGHSNLIGVSGSLPTVRPQPNGMRLTVNAFALARSPVNNVIYRQAGARVNLTLFNPERGHLGFSDGFNYTDANGEVRITTTPALPPVGAYRTPGGTLYDIGQFWLHAGSTQSEVRRVYITQFD